MRNAAKLRAIYAELRSVVGGAAAAGDLLRLAHIILKSLYLDLDRIDVFGRPRESRTFLALPVDEAMKDGGWQVLNFEAHRNFAIEDLDPSDAEVLKIRIQNLLGPEWRTAFRRETNPPKPRIQESKVEDGKN